MSNNFSTMTTMTIAIDRDPSLSVTIELLCSILASPGCVKVPLIVVNYSIVHLFNSWIQSCADFHQYGRVYPRTEKVAGDAVDVAYVAQQHTSNLLERTIIFASFLWFMRTIHFLKICLSRIITAGYTVQWLIVYWCCGCLAAYFKVVVNVCCERSIAVIGVSKLKWYS